MSHSQFHSTSAVKLRPYVTSSPAWPSILRRAGSPAGDDLQRPLPVGWSKPTKILAPAPEPASQRRSSGLGHTSLAGFAAPRARPAGSIAGYAGESPRAAARVRSILENNSDAPSIGRYFSSASVSRSGEQSTK